MGSDHVQENPSMKAEFFYASLDSIVYVQILSISANLPLKDFQTETVYGKDYLKGTTYYYPRHFKIYPWTLPNWRKTVYPDGSVLTPLPYPIASAEMLF